MSNRVSRRLTRRNFVRAAGLTGLAAVAAACSPATRSSTPGGSRASSAPTPFTINKDAAKAEGKVVGYGSMITSLEDALRQILQAHDSLPYEFVRIPTQAALITRVDTEQNAGVHSVDFLDNDTSSLDYVAGEGFLQKMPEEIWQRVPESWRDPKGYWVGWFQTMEGWIYNTQLVSPADAPKTQNDLLDPKWKGKIALASPVVNDTFARWFYFQQKQLGQDAADKFFHALAAQRVTLFDSGLTVSTNVNQGQFAIGLGFLTHVLSVGGPGGHMAYMPLNPQPATTSAISLLKQQPHPNAALVLADAMIGQEFLQKVADLGYKVPLSGAHSALPGVDSLTTQMMPTIPDAEADKFNAYLKGIFAR